MLYVDKYNSPLGEMIMAADDEGLAGLWFARQKYVDLYNSPNCQEKALPIFVDTKRWLDIYFQGANPNFSVPLHFSGTEFQNRVWEILCEIPYGETVTYGEIAKMLAKEKGIDKMSAQAVGGAVGANNISIIVPCHRVVGANGSLTGYAAGIDKKIALLKLEKILGEKDYVWLGRNRRK